jgi:hypothetical protein
MLYAVYHLQSDYYCEGREVRGAATTRQMAEIWVTKGARHGSYGFFFIRLKMGTHTHQIVGVLDRSMLRSKHLKEGNSFLLLGFIQHLAGSDASCIRIVWLVKTQGWDETPLEHVGSFD